MTPELLQLRTDLADARDEIATLRAQLGGDIPGALWRLQSKVQRQRHALDVLNRKLLSVHFALRLMNRLRPPVTAGEWNTARAELEDERLRGRVDEKIPVPA